MDVFLFIYLYSNQTYVINAHPATSGNLIEEIFPGQCVQVSSMHARTVPSPL